MSAPREVVIDGVRYVPATEGARGIPDLLRILALQFHTESTFAKYGTADLRILVDDGLDSEAGETFDELADRLARGEGR